MANIISTSKQVKALKQIERDAQQDNTNRLNQLFNKLKSSGAIQLRKDQSNPAPLPNEQPLDSKQTYDFLVF